MKFFRLVNKSIFPLKYYKILLGIRIKKNVLKNILRIFYCFFQGNFYRFNNGGLRSITIMIQWCNGLLRLITFEHIRWHYVIYMLFSLGFILIGERHFDPRNFCFYQSGTKQRYLKSSRKCFFRMFFQLSTIGMGF